jgi:hypothetical protein
MIHTKHGIIDLPSMFHNLLLEVTLAIFSINRIKVHEVQQDRSNCLIDEVVQRHYM